MLKMLIDLLIVLLAVTFLTIFSYVVLRKYKRLKKVTLSEAGTAIVLGSGGHTTEMFKLLSTLDLQKFTPRTYFVADSDEFSLKKLIEFEKERTDYQVHIIPRAREVGQSYFGSVFTSFRALWRCISPVYRMTADVLLVNGPGTCVPITCLYLIFNLTGKVIYIESICRVKTLSLSCKLLRKFVTVTLVQWPELEHKFRDTKFIGKLV
eukprot:TRINITY_DN22374_c0_g1_i2.p1 TRINITY_DN22374_c0_g1~~TRINITY_DN22374_c0_g1_i2.p1  ORF type:complete len:208 (+),score=3.64 TRINITY_DN22374_c0_g1_i2:38-661(+)